MTSKLLIQAENIQMKFGEQEVLNIDRLAVYEGERIGLVGANGAGKTTLLRVLAEELIPDRGTVKTACDICFFRQFAEEMPDEDSDPDSFSRNRLGFDRFALDGKAVSDLHIQDKVWAEEVSGGEETRLRLAYALSGDRPLVFFDEPTSNLDRSGIAVLTRRLQAIDTMIIVSHDRALLNALCSRIIELEHGGLTSYDGNYDDYTEQKQAAVARQWTEYESYTAEKRRLEKVYQEKKVHAKQIDKRPKNMSPREAGLRNFLSHHPKDAKARKMEKSAANVQQRINALEVKEKPRELPGIRPDFRLTDPPENRIVIRGEDICFSYKNGPEIFQNASFQIANHSRVAIVGNNGAGKTTLVHLIQEAAQNRFMEQDQFAGRPRQAEECARPAISGIMSGRISVVPKAAVGLFEQNLSTLDYSRTVLENVMDVSIQKEAIARTTLSRLLFFESDMKKPAGILSGGERIKLAFARLFVSRVNLLILDEPTNYLDIPSIEALEAMFAEYEGTLVFVSHDEEFIRRVATDILEVRDGRIFRVER
ncbi:MAG: ATP-binding cassette domain-containing protein [Lachnospiraceae bacterium]|nr:ATP-binding cassette domain-containing protein [Lachnospiraceae bacterium]